MLKRRLIPKLQMRVSRMGSGRRMVLVTTNRFGQTNEIGDPISQAKIYQAQAADELIFLDLDASADDRAVIVDVIRDATREIFMPITVGGGVRTPDDVRMLLQSGADKVAINTAAMERPELIGEVAGMFGRQCVVVSIDFRCTAHGGWGVWTRGGRTDSGRGLVDWAQQAEECGAGEILITSIDRDGTRTGLDLDATRSVVDAVSIPVITSGGCGAARHFVEGFQTGGADAVSAGTYFCFKDENPMQTRSQIQNAGIPIRMHL